MAGADETDELEGTEGTDVDEPNTAQEESVSDILGRTSTKTYIRFNVGAFLIIGVGYGLALLLLDTFADGNGADGGAGEFLVIGFVFAFLLGPIVAAITGAVTGLRLQDTERAAGIAAGVGAFAGFLALIFVMLIMGSIVGGEADEMTGELTDEFLSIIGFGIGVAVSGGGMAFFTKRFS